MGHVKGGRVFGLEQLIFPEAAFLCTRPSAESLCEGVFYIERVLVGVRAVAREGCPLQSR